MAETNEIRNAGTYAKLILPHICLFICLGIYTISGAAIFHLLELPHELKVRNETLAEIKSETAKTLTKLWKITLEDKMDEEQWLSKANDQLRELKKILYDSYENKFISFGDIQNDQDGNGTRPNFWTFPQSILFATSVVTTIGSGNVVPKTTSCKIFCIIFGLFGIPLLWITISDIGKYISDLMKYLYFWCKIYSYKVYYRLHSLVRSEQHPEQEEMKNDEPSYNNEDERLPWIIVTIVLTFYIAFGALLFYIWENWKYFDAFFSCFYMLTTVGFGDALPKRQSYLFFTIAYILVGLALKTICIDLVGTAYIAKMQKFDQKNGTDKPLIGDEMVSGHETDEKLLKHKGYGFRKSTNGKSVEIVNDTAFTETVGV